MGHSVLSRLVVTTAIAVATGYADAAEPVATVSREQAAAVSRTMASRLSNTYHHDSLSSGVYVGSEYCLACHRDHEGWRNTKHAQALRRPLAQYSLISGKGVVADHDGNGVDDFLQGLDFNRIDTVFNPYKPNAPVLSHADGTYYITIGAKSMPVVATQGGTGSWKQRYLVRVPVSDGADGHTRENYVSPVQYNEKTRQYALYHPDAWYDASGRPLFEKSATTSMVAAKNTSSYSKNCIGCHTTGIRKLAQDSDGQWRYYPYPATRYEDDDPGYLDYDHDGQVDILNVGCEACHGPGSSHVLAGGDSSKIVNPGKLTPAEANEVCGQCHARVKSVPEGLHGFPYEERRGRHFVPGAGQALSSFFTDASGRWPDGVNSKQHHQQYLDFLKSGKPGFRFHPVMCIECHDSHGDTTNDHQIRDFIIEKENERQIRIATRIDDNTLCLACHSTHGSFSKITKEMVADYESYEDAIARIVTDHTKHPYAPERRMGLSRCSKCHNPAIAISAVAYDVHSHTFEAISPEKTLRYREQGGMPNVCAVACHATKVDSFDLGIDPDLATWDETHDAELARHLIKYFGR